MREKWQNQMPLMAHIMNHAQCQELEAISAIIDAQPTICETILQDLNKGKAPLRQAGANGMSADQVVRCAIVKVLYGFTYEELAFHIVDSQALRWFCRIGIAADGFQKSALNANIKRISDSTWELINRAICWAMPKTMASRKVVVCALTAPALKAIFILPRIRPCCGMPCAF